MARQLDSSSSEEEEEEELVAVKRPRLAPPGQTVPDAKLPSFAELQARG